MLRATGKAPRRLSSARSRKIEENGHGMKITCQACQAKYTIADDKVVGKVVKIRCKKCGATIVVNGSDGSVSASQPPAQDGAFDYGKGSSPEAWTVNVNDGDQRSMT